MVIGSASRKDILLLQEPSPAVVTSKATKPSQVLQLRLEQEAAEDFLNSCRQKEKISFRFGPRILLHHGKKTLSISSQQEAYPTDVYRSSADHDGTFYFSGKLSHVLETQQAQKDTAKADEALANLQNSLSSHKAEKAKNEARFVTDRDQLRQLAGGKQKGRMLAAPTINPGKGRPPHGNIRSAPPNSFGGVSPNAAENSITITTSTSEVMTQDQVRLNAVKLPLLHLLATGPATLPELKTKLRASAEDCQRWLQRYCIDAQAGTGRYKLKDKAYRELDIWKFPYPHAVDREIAIDGAISAFDRMRINPTDTVWEKLLSPEERGKGKGQHLSRLRLGRPTLPVTKMPNGPKKAGGSRKDDGETKTAGEETLAGESSSSGQSPSAKTTNKNVHTGSGSRTTANQPSNTMPKQKDSKSQKRKTTSSGSSNFKSSATIDDSDEEIEDVPTLKEDAVYTKPARSPATTPRSDTGQKSTATNILNTGQGTVQPRNNGGLSPSSATNRSRVDLVEKKGSPRNRTGSSPQKPSPLSTSLPTNAADLERNSPSDKANHRPPLAPSSSSQRVDRNNRDQAHENGAPRREMTSKEKSRAGQDLSASSKRKAEEDISPAPKRPQQSRREEATPTGGAGRSATASTTPRHRGRVLSSPSSASVPPSDPLRNTATTTPSSSSSPPPAVTTTTTIKSPQPNGKRRKVLVTPADTAIPIAGAAAVVAAATPTMTEATVPTTKTNGSTVTNARKNDAIQPASSFPPDRLDHVNHTGKHLAAKSSPGRHEETQQSTSKSQTAIMQRKTRRFKNLYTRYSSLHAKLMATDVAQRDPSEIKLLDRMHDRVKELKGEIWKVFHDGAGNRREGGRRVGANDQK